MKLRSERFPNLNIKGLMRFRDGYAEVDDSLSSKLGPYEKHYGIEVITETDGDSSGVKPLADMKLNELKAHADEAEIDLGGATRKDDIIAAIEAASSPAETIADPDVEHVDDAGEGGFTLANGSK